jgi:hypothetical protein
MSSTTSKILVIWLCAMFATFAACGGGGSKTKGGGVKGTAAKTSGQKAGGTAEGDKSKGTSMGESYEGVTCDASTEGLAWCDSVTDIAFCAGGTWFLLDCSHPDIGGDFCGDDGETIDCYAADEF